MAGSLDVLDAKEGMCRRPAMTMTETYRQHPDPLTDEQRAIRKRSADLCRAKPAVWAAMVRRSDQLEADGMERYAASEQALREFGG